MVVYLDSLQKPNGLFYHAPDVPFFWGRGDGWMAVGMSELFRSLPKNNPNYERIMKGYKTMMASLLKYQAENGMWRQLIDDPESWPETSCTGMFTFAMITGVKNGWLDEATYGPAARKAGWGWLLILMRMTMCVKYAKAPIKRMTGNIILTANAISATCTGKLRYYGALLRY